MPIPIRKEEGKGRGSVYAEVAARVREAVAHVHGGI